MTLTFDTLCFTDIIDFDGNKIGKELIILNAILDTDGTEEDKYNIILEKYDDDICSINNWAGKYTVDYLIAKDQLITFERRINDLFSDGNVLLDCHGKETLKIERIENKLIGTYTDGASSELYFRENGWVVFPDMDPWFFFSKTKYAALQTTNPNGLCKLQEQEAVRQHDESGKKCWCGDSH